MPAESTEESTFPFPEYPGLAVVRLTILVKSDAGGNLKMSAKLFPGSKTWDYEETERIFSTAQVAPREGTYTLEIGPSNTNLCVPEGVDNVERRNLSRVMYNEISGIRQCLVQNLRTFTSDEVILDAARKVVSIINVGSFERSALLDATPVVDARTVEIRSVDCIYCDFGVEACIKWIVDEVFNDQRPDDMKFTVINQNGQPVVLVGYLSHSSVFAAVLNKELARRLKAAVESVIMEEMIDTLVEIAVNSRRCDHARRAIQATYNIDPTIVDTRVDAIQAKARKFVALKGKKPATVH